MMPEQTSNFVHNDNQQLAGLSGSDDEIWAETTKGTPYEGMSIPAALGLGLATFVIGAVTSTWVGAHILGYDD